MTEKLSVCFIWHMHQPLYKDRLSGQYLMPWVRLHAIKDYLDMALILRDFPKVKQTFNLVPSLMEQLNDYGWHNAVDEQLKWTCKHASEYTQQDKIGILTMSFHANLERQIKPNKPYYELWVKRQHLLDRGHHAASMVNEFSEQEYADMCTWMNLAWFDPMWFEKMDELQSYLTQGREFHYDRRNRLIEIQREIIRQIIPTYRALQDEGQIEIITSPYYHPILPLLIDTNSAKISDPNVRLPERIYFHRQDALAQLEKGIAYYEEMFGRRPQGMWPSELSVSPAALELISQVGINWVVIDEALLSKTIHAPIFRDDHGNLNSPEFLCQPYRLQAGDYNINLLFREVVTSNEIGFSFGGRSPQEAATALCMRLKYIQQKLFNWEREGMVAIALDGENCWETYEKDGRPFLQELYHRLSEDSSFDVCTVSDYLKRNPSSAELHNIHSGSWISSDFHIWIGDPVKNKAWDLLSRTRHFLMAAFRQGTHPPEDLHRAWEEIYTAEGSDWFWWFGEPNNSHDDAIFDHQFRLRLQNVYTLLGQPYPKDLDFPLDQHAYEREKIPELL